MAEWQTRQVQDLVGATSWGFESPLRHLSVPHVKKCKILYSIQTLADFGRQNHRGHGAIPRVALARERNHCDNGKPVLGIPVGQMFKFNRYLNFALMLSAVLLLFAACGPKKEKAEPEEHTVAMGKIREAVICDGNIEAMTTVEIKSKASGILEFRGFEEGEVVKAGELMFRLDKSLIQQNITQAEARVKSARAQLELTRRNQTPAQRIDLQNAVEQAKIDVQDAIERYNRIKELYERDYATPQELDDADAALERARLRLKLAEDRLKESDSGGTKEQIEVAQASVTLAEADLKNALEELRETEIVAPITGVVLTQEVEIGDTITSATRGAASGTVLAIIGDMSSIYLRGFVDETDVGRLKIGMPAEISVNSYPGRKFIGKLVKIYPMAAATSGVTTFKVDVEITGGGFVTRQNPDAKPLPKTDSKETDAAETEGEKPENPGGGNENSGASANSPGGGGRGPNGGSGQSRGRNSETPSNEPVEIRVGMTADAQIIIRDVPEALIIPVTYVNFRAKPPEVNVKDGSQTGYTAKPIKVGFTDGVNIVVEEGLSDGEIVVRVPREEKAPLRR